MTQPLALDSAAVGEAAGWRRHEDLIDALPYVDTMSPEEKQKVDRMIQEEMKNSTMRPAAYLKDLAPAYNVNFEGHPVLLAEMARIKAGLTMENLDDIRYRLDKPSLAKRNDVSAWKKALDNAHSQLGHQHNRVINLELLLKFGPKAWRVQNARLAAANSRLEAEVAGVREEVEAVNRERKLQQTSAGADLAALEARWHRLVLKNAEIERACQQLEAEVAKAQGAAAPQQPDDAGDDAEDGREPAAADQAAAEEGMAVANALQPEGETAPGGVAPADAAANDHGANGGIEIDAEAGAEDAKMEM